MKYFSKIFSSQYIIGTIYYTLPGVLSIFISLFSIPIFLNFLNTDLYASYLISHFVLTLSMITNLSFNKIAIINIAKKKVDKESIIFTSLLFTTIFSSLASVILFFISIHMIEKFQLNNLKEITDLKILTGLIITNFYFTLEGIYKGNLSYKGLSIFNLFFYSISLSLPCILVLYKIDLNLFSISLTVKFLVVFVMLILLVSRYKIKKFKLSQPFIRDCFLGLKWMTLNATLNQIYNYFDKYIIKIFLDNISFIFYSISQQITSKIGDPLVAYNNIFIAKTTYNKKTRGNSLSFSCIFYCIYIFTMFLPLYFFLDDILKIWLGDAYSTTYLDLIKIFFLIATVGTFSNLLIDFNDLSKNSKINSQVEFMIIIPFFIGIILSINYENLFFFVFVILAKELLAILIRIYKLKHLIFFKNFIFIQFLLILTNVFLWFLNLNIIFTIVFQILHIIIYLPVKKIRQFYSL